MPGGRPKGTKNAPGHSAGGKRKGSGRKEKVYLFFLASWAVVTTLGQSRLSNLLNYQIQASILAVKHYYFRV